jgi:hypothetical protein
MSHSQSQNVYIEPCNILLSYLHLPISRFQPIYAGAFPFSCASIFLLAAKIISSLLFCKFICLSFLSALHAFFGVSSCAGSSVCANFEDKLYLVIRSGCVGFVAGRAAVVAVRGAAAGAGVGKLKDGGAYITPH